MILGTDPKGAAAAQRGMAAVVITPAISTVSMANVGYRRPGRHNQTGGRRRI